MKNPLRRDSKAVAEKKIRQVESLITTIDKKVTLTEHEVDKHKAARRQLLLEDPGTEVPAAIRHGLSNAEAQLVALREERSDLCDVKREIEEGLAAALAAEQRDEAAKVLELAATDLEKASTELDTAIGGVERAFRRILEAVPPTMATYEQDHETRPPGRAGGGRFASAHELASALLAEALFGAVPQAFDVMPVSFVTGLGKVVTHAKNVVLHRMAELDGMPRANFRDGITRGMDGYSAAAAVTGQWRARARAMRTGDLVPDPSMIATDWPKLPDEGMREVKVFAVKPFSYVENKRGGRRLCGRRNHLVPGYVADAAVSVGAALRRGTPAGDAADEKDQRYRATTLTQQETGLRFEDCVDLGDPCGFLGREDLTPMD